MYVVRPPPTALPPSPPSFGSVGERACVRARTDGGTVFPPWRTRSLTRLLSRRPAAARASSVLPWPPSRRLLADPSLLRGGDDSLRRLGVNGWGRFAFKGVYLPSDVNGDKFESVSK